MGRPFHAEEQDPQAVSAPPVKAIGNIWHGCRMYRLLAFLTEHHERACLHDVACILLVLYGLDMCVSDFRHAKKISCSPPQCSRKARSSENVISVEHCLLR